MNEIKDKVALITGGASGLGLEFARILSKKGYRLVLTSRFKDKPGQAHGLSAVLIRSDLSERGAAEKLFRECQERDLRIDVLINNAGRGLFGEHVDVPFSEIEKMIMLNVVSVTELCNLFGSKMKERKSGFILNIASLAAYQPVPLLASYGATKSYILYFSEALAKELEDYNVVVCCLSPGPTDTNFYSSAGLGDETTGFLSKKRRMTAQQVAEYGINALFSAKLSVIHGIRNWLLVQSVRFAPRSAVARISKRISQSP